MKSRLNPTPPKLAQWLVRASSPARVGDCILGDMEEEFHQLVTQSDLPTARHWYWRQALGSTPALIEMRAQSSLAVAVGLVLITAWLAFATWMAVASTLYSEAYGMGLFQGSIQAALGVRLIIETIGFGLAGLITGLILATSNRTSSHDLLVLVGFCVAILLGWPLIKLLTGNNFLPPLVEIARLTLGLLALVGVAVAVGCRKRK